MSKKRLVERLRSKFLLSPADAEKAIDVVFTALAEELVDNQTVRIPGFGTFRRVFVDTRTTRNPRTGATSTKLAHHKIKFREEKPRTPK